MSDNREVEIKFRVADLAALEQKLRDTGFRLVTPRTHEMNTLYDLPGGPLRSRSEVLRIRKYGDQWKLTHKSKPQNARHKSRRELESAVADGAKLDLIFRALGFEPSFRYEKFRSEWTDGAGHVVLDETPIGNLAEIEGAPEWIDRVAKALGVADRDYITDSYMGLFLEWKRKTGSHAEEMTFDATGTGNP